MLGRVGEPLRRLVSATVKAVRRRARLAADRAVAVQGLGPDWAIFGSALTKSGLPGAWPDSNGAATPGFSDARYRRRALGRPASKRSTSGPKAVGPSHAADERHRRTAVTIGGGAVVVVLMEPAMIVTVRCHWQAGMPHTRPGAASGRPEVALFLRVGAADGEGGGPWSFQSTIAVCGSRKSGASGWHRSSPRFSSSDVKR